MSTPNTNPNFAKSFCGFAARQKGLEPYMCLRANSLAIMGARLREMSGVYTLNQEIEGSDKQSIKLRDTVANYLGDLNAGDLAKVQAKGAELIKACGATSPGTLTEKPTKAFIALFPVEDKALTADDQAEIDLA